MGITLREAGVSDAPRLSVMTAQTFIATYAREGIDDAFVREVRFHADEAAIEKLLREGACRFLLAEQESRLLGFAQWQPEHGNEWVRVGRPAEVKRLYVLESFIRSGIGTALLQHVEADWAREGGDVLWLDAWIGNERALAFYRRRGYSDVGRADYTFEGESFENRIFMKQLSTATP